MKFAILKDTKIWLLGAALVAITAACGRDGGGQEAATPPAPPPQTCPANTNSTPSGCTAITVACQAGFIQTEKGCLQQGIPPCGTNEGYDPVTRICYRGTVSGVVGQSFHYQARIFITNQDQFAWFLEQKSREAFGSPMCQKNNAFGSYSCAYYAGSEAYLDLQTPAVAPGQVALYTVSISPSRVNFPIPIRMNYQPTGESSGFSLYDNVSYGNTEVRAVRGNLNDNTIDIEVFYKQIIIGHGQMTRSF